MLFTIPFYHFLFLTYFDLAEHHFLSDILVAFPDLSDLYTCGDSLMPQRLALQKTKRKYIS